MFKGGFFERLKQGLSKTREGFVQKVESLTKGYDRVTPEMLDELEETLIEADLGVKLSMDLMQRLKERLKEEGNRAERVRSLIAQLILETLQGKQAPLTAPGLGPTVYMVVGVNGSGKTTTIGKLAHRWKAEGHTVLLGAGDTFRAAAIDQLEIWARRAGVDIIKHQEGADPGAVAYDAVKAAISRGVDILILDTAGRLQTKTNLMQELAKVYRVVGRELGRPPDEVLLVIDATTGQNGLSQARHFKDATPVTGIALTKLDGTAKGGIVVSISAELEIPVKLVGVGETADDLREFEPDAFVQALFGEVDHPSA